MKKIIICPLMLLILFGYLNPIIHANTLSSLPQQISLTGKYDMIIIAPESYSSTILPLINHKNQRNVQTIQKNVEEIYNECPGRDQPEQIKYFIKNAKETWNITSILLIGDAAQIPCRYTHIYFEYDYQTEWIFPSDLYYADLYFPNGSFSSWDTNNNNLFAEYNWSGQNDILDFSPDINIGRLPCTNTDQVTTVIQKIMTYENNNAWNKPWFKNLVLIGGDSLPGDEYHVDEGEYVNQHVINILTGFNPEKIWASLDKLNYALNINQAINPGAGFVFFNGHGNIDRWATHPHESNEWVPPGSYKNIHINTLTNGEKLPIIISDACYHCAYDKNSDVFGWTFLKQPNGGAIAFLGGTDIDVSYAGEAIITKGIERLCLLISTNYIGGDTTFGELWRHGIQTYISDSMDEIDIITVTEFQPFGDPSLSIADSSAAPKQPSTPSGPSQGKQGIEYTYQSITTDPDNDMVYYQFDWDDDSNSNWLGPYESGEIVYANHTWNRRGTYNICVRAMDDNGMVSSWSDPMKVTMPLTYLPEFQRLILLLLQILGINIGT